MEEHPFPDLLVTSADFLNCIEERHPCKQCSRSRKYYCYTCIKPLDVIADKIPKVQLPLRVDVIKHPRETDGKSTAIHAAILAPDQVHVYTYPEIPDYSDNSKVVLVFPGDKAMSFEDLIAAQKSAMEKSEHEDRDSERLQASSKSTVGTGSELKHSNNGKDTDATSHQEHINDKHVVLTDSESPQTNITSESAELVVMSTSCKRGLGQLEVTQLPDEKKLKCDVNPAPPFHTVVFIDSTWNQTKKIISDERLQGLPQVKLSSRETKFWRHQKGKPKTFLATIEAIYYFLRDFHVTFIDANYKGQYDDLLFFFMFMYKKIRTMYKDDHTKLKAYKPQEQPVRAKWKT